MGLTGACSYFQQSLMTQVLNGLMHEGCELFLDDCMIHATTLDEYLKRLRTVFLRFRASRITLNPKCHVGLSQVEYVGHTINKNGLHFTRDKLDSVLNFPRPETKKQITSRTTRYECSHYKILLASTRRNMHATKLCGHQSVTLHSKISDRQSMSVQCYGS